MKNDLTQEKLRELLHYDPLTGVFTRRVALSNRVKIGEVAGCDRPDGYLIFNVLGKLCLAHRLAWLYVYGTWPREELDHKNGDRKDNRIDTLREATHTENVRNSKVHWNNTSGFKGVSWSKEKRKWYARIMFNRMVIRLGYFRTAEAASEAYETAAEKYFGEFRRIA